LIALAVREDSVPNARSYTLWASLLGVVPSCGGGGGAGAPTCFLTNITYTGTKSGAAYLRVASDDGGQSLFHAVNAASIQGLIFFAQVQTCYEGAKPVDVPLTAVAWIDLSGASAANCSDVLHPQPLCQPAASDPQARQSAVLRFGQLTKLQLDVPP
jgi:hypothetical protein